jgi:hypothetical protein
MPSRSNSTSKYAAIPAGMGRSPFVQPQNVGVAPPTSRLAGIAQAAQAAQAAVRTRQMPMTPAPMGAPMRTPMSVPAPANGGIVAPQNPGLGIPGGPLRRY